MKIYLGPYKNWMGPYHLVDLLFFWHEKYPSDELSLRWDYKLHDRLAAWLASTWVNDLCKWIQSKRQRTIKIHIDTWDTWSMDHTLALIIVPMLKQLHANNHGAPRVDDEDVPENLKSTAAPLKEQEYDVDDNHFKRWDWVMEELIWTFEQCAMEDSTDQFFTHPTEKFDSLKDHMAAIKLDREGLDAHVARIENGLRLFGKYYRSLWD